MPPGAGEEAAETETSEGWGAALETAEARLLQRMEAFFAALRLMERWGSKGKKRAVLTTDHCNMLLLARLKAGQRAEAVALVEEMLVRRTAAPGDQAPLPPADGVSVCLALEALGKAGEWAACLALLQRAKEALPALDKAGMAMVYKTAIG